MRGEGVVEMKNLVWSFGVVWMQCEGMGWASLVKELNLRGEAGRRSGLRLVWGVLSVAGLA